MRKAFGMVALAAAALAAAPLYAQESYKIGYLVDASGPGQSIFSPTLEGFNLYSVNILIGTSLFPKASIRSLFSMFPVGPPVGNDLDLPFYTLYVTGFEVVSEVFIASTASVDLDDIVVEMH